MPVKKIPITEIRKKYKKLPIDRKWILIAILVYLITFFLKLNIVALIFLTIFCIANSLLLTIDRYVSLPLDVELSTFSAALMTMAYDVKWGISVAILTKIAAILYNRVVRMDHIFMIIGYVLSAIFTNIFKGFNFNIILIGIIITILVNIYTVFVSKFITMLSDYEIFTYGLSNTLFNIVLFIAFGDLFLKIMI